MPSYQGLKPTMNSNNVIINKLIVKLRTNKTRCMIFVRKKTDAKWHKENAHYVRKNIICRQQVHRTLRWTIKGTLLCDILK